MNKSAKKIATISIASVIVWILSGWQLSIGSFIAMVLFEWFVNKT